MVATFTVRQFLIGMYLQPSYVIFISSVGVTKTGVQECYPDWRIESLCIR
jgi:hypothetical protein